MTTETYIDLRKGADTGLIKKAVDKAKAGATAIRAIADIIEKHCAALPGYIDRHMMC